MRSTSTYYMQYILLHIHSIRSADKDSTHQQAKTYLMFGWDAMMWCDCRCDPRCYEVPGQISTPCCCQWHQSLPRCVSVVVPRHWKSAASLWPWVRADDTPSGFCPGSYKQNNHVWFFGVILGGTSTEFKTLPVGMKKMRPSKFRTCSEWSIQTVAFKWL